MHRNWSLESNMPNTIYVASSWVKTQTQAYLIQYPAPNHHDKLPQFENCVSTSPSAFLKHNASFVWKTGVSERYSSSHSGWGLCFHGHGASILGCSNQSNWMWPRSGDAGSRRQENPTHCTEPNAPAAFHLPAGLWGVGRESSLEFEDQQSPQGFG